MRLGSIRNLGLTLTCMLAAASGASAGPVGYWSFDGNTSDLSGNGNNAVASNLSYSSSVPTQLATSNTQSGSFDGADTKAQVTVSSTSSPLYLNNVETITLWMNASAGSQSAGYRRVFSTAAGGNGVEFQEDNTGTGSSVRIDTSGGNNQLTEIGNAYNGQWDFIAVVLNNGSVKTYFNGVLASTNAYTVGGGFGSTNPITFGNSDQESNDWYTGLLANAAIYGSALSDSQIGALYAGASPLSVPEPATAALLSIAVLGTLVRRRRV